MTKKVTLRQIARLSKVSIPTVSRVLRRSARVNPEIEARVREAAKRLGWDVSGREQRRVIAFLLSNRPISHPFHSEVMSGAESYCSEHDYQMLFSTLRYPLHVRLSHLPIPKFLERPGTVDGFIVAGVNTVSLLDLLGQTRRPFVVYGDTVMEGPSDGFASVGSDELGGAGDATRYLLSLGHTAIAFVANTRMPWFKRRFEGYRGAMIAAGLPPRVSEFDSDDERQVGYLAAKSIVDKGEAVTAIFAGNDHIAQGVYDALRDCGIKVGDKISVVGFNDTLESVVLHPALTTVRIHSEQIGRQLAELVLSAIEGRPTAHQKVTIPTRLVKRDSCMPLAARPEFAALGV